MKKLVILIFHLVFIHTLLSHDPFVVVLMVKNEASVINQTLEPFVKAGIDSYVIFDTGSTDNTVETVEQFFKQNEIKNWHIFQESFVDFAVSRNRALDLAEEHFPDAVFLLMPDAEWYIQNVEELIDFCNQIIDDNGKCYLIRMLDKNLDFLVPRLIRTKSNARFVGDIHECIDTDIFKKVPRNIFFRLQASQAGIEKSRKRWERDLEILLERYEENPDDSRTTFYLAQTYECLFDFVPAYTYYEIRSKQSGGSLEETYETFYRLGRVADILSKTDEQYTWHMAQDYYFTAHKLLPHRAEPLVRIAEYYWPESEPPKNAALCYLFAKRAYELTYPENDTLFIDPEVYFFWRYELVSKSAWQMGDFELGEICTRKALQYKESPHLLRNLACYIEMR